MTNLTETRMDDIIRHLGDSVFPIILLLGRPAAGKSEILDYLRRTPDDERRIRFHVGRLVEIDDFPMLWAWMEEDTLLSRMGRRRLHTTPDGYFKYRHLWDVLIHRLGLEYDKWRRDGDPCSTVILEFSRGTQHGGYRAALPNFSEDILEQAAAMYVAVSWEESLRKNRRRFNPERPDSILEHGLPDAKLERLYRGDDWRRMAPASEGRLPVGSRWVPYAVFDNEDDVTTPRGPALGHRLEETLERLWRLRRMGS